MTPLCRAATVESGHLVQVRDAEGRAVTLARLADGAIVAFDGRCPHRNGPLWAGQVAGDAVVCPWHGFKFDLRTGGCAGMESIMKLTRRPVTVRDGIVYLDGESK